MIQSDRLAHLAARPSPQNPRYVLYWMQQSQRAEFNPALEYAIEAANGLGLPVLVAFVFERLGEAPARPYAFMVEGLRDVAQRLAQRGLGFVTRWGPTEAAVIALAADAALLVCDAGYLRGQRRQRDAIAAAAPCPFVRVEGDVVVPLATASPKHEYAARTLRPKLHRVLEEHVQPLQARRAKRRWAEGELESEIDLADFGHIAKRLKLDMTVSPVRRFQGGETEARRRLDAFLDVGLARYASERNRPEAHAVSELSPYLRFGQISPVEIVLAARETKVPGAERAAFVEELVVRRELAFNHIWYELAYDRYESLPDWAQKALARAADDPRPHLYDRKQLEAGETHDRYWNAAMREMTATGYMHNRLRMYWGKKILQWSTTPQAGFAATLALNNRWFIDGRDANAFTNVAWLFGLHDRPWGAQPVFGTVRSMGQNTFKSFDAEAYVADVERMAAAETG